MNIGLTAAELSDMRTAINDLLPGTGDFYSIGNTLDGFGGYSEGTTIVTGGSNVPYRLDPLNTSIWGRELIAGGAINPFHTFILTVAESYGTVINETCLFKAGTAYYSIKSVDNKHNNKSWAASTRILVEQL